MYYYINSEKYKQNEISFGDMDITLKSIGYFIKVVEYGNISKAAENIYVSQPYLSKTIKSLEERLGFDLFTRERNKLVLTAQGNEFYKTFRPIIYSIQEHISVIKSSGFPIINLAVQNILDIFKIYEKGFISPLFKSESCNVMYYDIFEITKRVAEGNVDTAIIISECAEFFPDYDVSPIGKVKRMIVVSENDEFAKRESVSFEELLGREIVFYIEGNCEPKMYISMIEKYCEKHGLNPRNISFAENFQTALFDVMLNENKLMLVEELLPDISSKGLVTIPVNNADYDLVALVNKKASKEKSDIIKKLYNKMA